MLRPNSLQKAWGNLDAWHVLRTQKINEIVRIMQHTPLQFNEFLHVLILARAQIAAILHPDCTREILKRRMNNGEMSDELKSCALEQGRYQDFIPFLRTKYELNPAVQRFAAPVFLEAFGAAKEAGLSYRVHSQTVVQIEDSTCSILSKIDVIDANKNTMSSGFYILHTNPRNIDKLLDIVAERYDQLINTEASNIEKKIGLIKEMIFYFCQASPQARGSAGIAEMMAEVQLIHNKIPYEFDNSRPPWI